MRSQDVPSAFWDGIALQALVRGCFLACGVAVFYGALLLTKCIQDLFPAILFV